MTPPPREHAWQERKRNPVSRSAPQPSSAAPKGHPTDAPLLEQRADGLPHHFGQPAAPSAPPGHVGAPWTPAASTGPGWKQRPDLAGGRQPQGRPVGGAAAAGGGLGAHVAANGPAAQHTHQQARPPVPAPLRYPSGARDQPARLMEPKGMQSIGRPVAQRGVGPGLGSVAQVVNLQRTTASTASADDTPPPPNHVALSPVGSPSPTADALPAVVPHLSSEALNGPQQVASPPASSVAGGAPSGASPPAATPPPPPAPSAWGTTSGRSFAAVIGTRAAAAKAAPTPAPSQPSASSHVSRAASVAASDSEVASEAASTRRAPPAGPAPQSPAPVQQSPGPAVENTGVPSPGGDAPAATETPSPCAALMQEPSPQRPSSPPPSAAAVSVGPPADEAAEGSTVGAALSSPSPSSTLPEVGSPMPPAQMGPSVAQGGPSVVQGGERGTTPVSPPPPAQPTGHSPHAPAGRPLSWAALAARPARGANRPLVAAPPTPSAVSAASPAPADSNPQSPEAATSPPSPLLPAGAAGAGMAALPQPLDHQRTASVLPPPTPDTHTTPATHAGTSVPVEADDAAQSPPKPVGVAPVSSVTAPQTPAAQAGPSQPPAPSPADQGLDAAQPQEPAHGEVGHRGGEVSPAAVLVPEQAADEPTPAASDALAPETASAAPVAQGSAAEEASAEAACPIAPTGAVVNAAVEETPDASEASGFAPRDVAVKAEDAAPVPREGRGAVQESSTSAASPEESCSPSPAPAAPSSWASRLAASAARAPAQAPAKAPTRGRAAPSVIPRALPVVAAPPASSLQAPNELDAPPAVPAAAMAPHGPIAVPSPPTQRVHHPPQQHHPQSPQPLTSHPQPQQGQLVGHPRQGNHPRDGRRELSGGIGSPISYRPASHQFSPPPHAGHGAAAAHAGHPRGPRPASGQIHQLWTPTSGALPPRRSGSIRSPGGGSSGSATPVKRAPSVAVSEDGRASSVAGSDVTGSTSAQGPPSAAEPAAEDDGFTVVKGRKPVRHAGGPAYGARHTSGRSVSEAARGRGPGRGPGHVYGGQGPPGGLQAGLNQGYRPWSGGHGARPGPKQDGSGQGAHAGQPHPTATPHPHVVRDALEPLGPPPAHAGSATTVATGASPEPARLPTPPAAWTAPETLPSLVTDTAGERQPPLAAQDALIASTGFSWADEVEEEEARRAREQAVGPNMASPTEAAPAPKADAAISAASPAVDGSGPMVTTMLATPSVAAHGASPSPSPPPPPTSSRASAGAPAAAAPVATSLHGPEATPGKAQMAVPELQGPGVRAESLEEEAAADSAVHGGTNAFSMLADATDVAPAVSLPGTAATAPSQAAAALLGPVAAALVVNALDTEPHRALQALLAAGSVTGERLAGADSAAAAAAARFPPRGLVNTGNSCFVNSPLQALLGCGQFCMLLRQLAAARTLLDPQRAPTLRGLAELAAQLAGPPGAGGCAAVDGSTRAASPGLRVNTPPPTSLADGGAGDATTAAADADGTADAGAGWSQVPKAKRRAKATSMPLAVFANGAPAAAAASNGKKHGGGGLNAGGSGGGASTAHGSAVQPGSASLGGLWRTPLVPSALNDIIRRFSPAFAAQAATATIPATPPPQHPSAPPMDKQVPPSGAAAPARPPTPPPRIGGVAHQEQQDAQEFLHFLLDKAHEELLALAQANACDGGDGTDGGAGGDGDEDDGQWAQVGRRNKVAVTRVSGLGGPAQGGRGRTAVNALFAGATKSVVKSTHAKPSATVEPFMMLHLDIEVGGVGSVEAALAHHLANVQLTDYKPEGCTVAAPAVKQLYLYRLPPLLALHLKRFAYTGSIVKYHKHIAFELTLRLRKPVVGEDCPDVERGSGAEYALIATVSHHGKHAAGGHYTADVLQPDGTWLRFNDTAVDAVSPAAVLHEQPYLLLYQRTG